jgi:hypothetical protein
MGVTATNESVSTQYFAISGSPIANKGPKKGNVGASDDRKHTYFWEDMAALGPTAANLVFMFIRYIICGDNTEYISKRNDGDIACFSSPETIT